MFVLHSNVGISGVMYSLLEKHITFINFLKSLKKLRLKKKSNFFLTLTSASPEWLCSFLEAVEKCTRANSLCFMRNNCVALACLYGISSLW